MDGLKERIEEARSRVDRILDEINSLGLTDPLRAQKMGDLRDAQRTVEVLEAEAMTQKRGPRTETVASDNAAAMAALKLAEAVGPQDPAARGQILVTLAVADELRMLRLTMGKIEDHLEALALAAERRNINYINTPRRIE